MATAIAANNSHDANADSSSQKRAFPCRECGTSTRGKSVVGLCRSCGHLANPVCYMYLYIIECQGFYKIGTTKMVYARLNNIKTCNPFPVNLITQFRFKDAESANTAETYLHKKFQALRERGEWFRLRATDVEWVNAKFENLRQKRMCGCGKHELLIGSSKLCRACYEEAGA